MADTPAFDPSKPYTKVSGSTPATPSPAPAFDPGKPFTKIGGASPTSAGSPAAPVIPLPAAAGSKPYEFASRSSAAQYGQKPENQKPTFDEFMGGAEAWARSASYNTSDDASAGIAAAIMKAKGDPRAMKEIYSQLDNAENQRIDDWEKKNGKWPEYLGWVTGPGAVRAGQWIGRGANWIGRGLRASASGAAGAAVNDVGAAAPDKKLDLKRTATAAGVGAAVGPLMQGTTEVVSPALSQAAQRLIAQGVRPRVGQLMGGAAKTTEEKIADTVPLLGDAMNSQQTAAIHQFNRATFNNVLEPLGIQVPRDQEVGREGYRAVKQVLDDHFEDLLPRLTLHVDHGFQQGMTTLDRMAAALPDAQRQAYARTMQAQFADKLTINHGQGSMLGDTFKGVESELGERAQRLRSDPSVDQQDLGQIYQHALTVFRSTLERQNPAHAPQLRAVNSAYARFTRLRDAMSKLGAHDGIFTPRQLLNAVKSGDRSRGKGSFAGGGALMQQLAEDGDQVIGSKYPNSGTAGRLLMSGAVGGALGAGATIEPHTAVGLAATTIPYLPGVRDWFSSPYAQGAGALLRQVNPAVSAQAGQQASRYIGQQ